jgi:hypothetical protein
MDDCACEMANPSTLTYEQKTEAVKTSKTMKVIRACGTHG